MKYLLFSFLLALTLPAASLLKSEQVGGKFLFQTYCYEGVKIIVVTHNGKSSAFQKVHTIAEYRWRRTKTYTGELRMGPFTVVDTCTEKKRGQ